MNKILFTTEFSDHSPQMFHYTLHLAQIFDAKVIMMHAFGIPTNVEEDPDFERRSEAVISELKAFKQEYLPDQFEDVDIEYLAQIGAAGNSILQVANDEDVDLIVMGTQGQNNTMDRIFGGVTSKIIGEAPCPLLLIPPSWVFNGLQTMACTTNFKFDDFRVLNTLRKWSKKFQGEVHCVHVLEKEQIEAANRKMKLLKDVFSHEKQIFFHPELGSTKEAIEKFANKVDADLLALVNHKAPFLGALKRNITKEIAQKVQLPLLIFDEL